ncbi:MAG: hypothetical protein AAGC67_04070 [Myxococcota bacterium]
MITLALSAAIGAPRERVWRALVDPSEREIWDDRVLGPVELSRRARSPERTHALEKKPVLRTLRWRFKLGQVPLVLQEEVIRADGHDRLVSRVTIGSMHFDQTLTLHAEDDETGPRTRLGMKIVATNSVAVIGEIIPRLDVQKLVMEYVDATLRQVQKHCEADA